MKKGNLVGRSSFLMFRNRIQIIECASHSFAYLWVFVADMFRHEVLVLLLFLSLLSLLLLLLLLRVSKLGLLMQFIAVVAVIEP